MVDPFYSGPLNDANIPSGSAYTKATYRYFCYKYGWGAAVGHVKDGYVILSYGPDKTESYGEWIGVEGRGSNWDGVYAPSNGINSTGDIVRAGGMVNPNAWQN